MALTTCPRCDKLFNKISSPCCPPCQEEEEKDYEIIRSSLEENPDINSEGIAELTGVKLEVIMRMLDDGRIASTALLERSKITCGRCGAPAISASKRLCQKCLDTLNKEMAETRRSIQLDAKKKVQLGEFGSGQTVRDAMDDKRRI